MNKPTVKHVWTKVFSSPDTFGAYREAETWLQARGYSVGRMCGPEPIGIKVGAEWDIQKWRNLSAQDVVKLDGQIVGDMRNGPVTVQLQAVPAGEEA